MSPLIKDGDGVTGALPGIHSSSVGGGVGAFFSLKTRNLLSIELSREGITIIMLEETMVLKRTA